MPTRHTVSDYYAQLAEIEANTALPPAAKATLVRFFRDLIRQEEEPSGSPMSTNTFMRRIASTLSVPYKSSSHLLRYSTPTSQKARSRTRRSGRTSTGSTRRRNRNGSH